MNQLEEAKHLTQKENWPCLLLTSMNVLWKVQGISHHSSLTPLSPTGHNFEA